MTIYEEIEKIIADLPPEQAISLKRWLKGFQAARWYKQIRAYNEALEVVANFKKNKSNAMWN